MTGVRTGSVAHQRIGASGSATRLGDLRREWARVRVAQKGGSTLSKRNLLEELQPKPRTTVKRFALDLKARIERAAVAFDQPGQAERVAGMRYVLGIVDAALSDYDVRDPR